MATAYTCVGVSIQFEKDRVTLHPGPYATVKDVVSEAAARFSQPSEGLSLIHKGTKLGDDEKIHDTSKGQATAFILQKTVKRHRPDRRPSSAKPQERLVGYCKGCYGVVDVRPLVTCKDCGRPFLFDDPSLVDYFNEMTSEATKGSCSLCNKTEPRINYQCKSCNRDQGVVFLPCLRYNERELPCMKCGEKDEIIILYTCPKRHTMCCECFGIMCQQLLSTGKFRMIDPVGYTINCPGPDRHCYSAPIVDPHHFYIIDGPKGFYEAVKEKAMEQYMPPGDAVLCVKCKTELDFTQGTDAEVTPVTSPTSPNSAHVQGGVWTSLHSFFTKEQPKAPSKPPKKQVRKRITCKKCNDRAYCCACKQVWHDGDCINLKGEEYVAYEIDREKAESSCWPAPKPI